MRLEDLPPLLRVRCRDRRLVALRKVEARAGLAAANWDEDEDEFDLRRGENSLFIYILLPCLLIVCFSVSVCPSVHLSVRESFSLSLFVQGLYLSQLCSANDLFNSYDLLYLTFD